MGIGKRIKEARDAKHWTQKELAEQIGVTPSAITNYENETSHPKEEILYRLINKLSVDANFLFQDYISTISEEKNLFLLDTIEREIIEIYRKLVPEAKDNARKYIGYLLFQQQEKEEDAAREAEKQRMLDELRKIEDQEEFEKLLTASYAAWGGQHGTVKLTEEGLKESIKLIKEDQKK